MCSCGSKKTTTVNKSSTGCKSLRSRLQVVKKKAYARYKLENNTEDYDVYRQISTDLANLSYCPEMYVVVAYETEYLT